MRRYPILGLAAAILATIVAGLFLAIALLA